MKALRGVYASSAQISSTPVHGPWLSGISKKLGIGAWAVLFLLCLAALIMSVSYADLWFRTPYTEISQLDPTIDPAAIEETYVPFQEAIFDLGLTLDIYSHYFTILRIFAATPYFVLSFLIIRRRSDRLMAVLASVGLCVVGAAGTIYNPLWWWIPESYPWHPFLDRLLGALLNCALIFFYTIPDGRFVPRWTRWLALLIALFAVANSFVPEESMLNPGNWPGALGFIPFVVFSGCGVFAVVHRYRHYGDAVQKQQIKWFAAGSALIVLAWFVDYAVWEIYPVLTGDYLIHAGRQAVLWELFQDTAWYVAQFLFVVCVAISVFRYRLWDIDLVVNRVLVYGSLTALTLLVYVAAVSALGSIFRGLAGQAEFFLATGLVAILFEPLHQRSQRAVNRLMYGERDDPYAVLNRLSSALETTPTPEDVLPALATQIGQALKIPYVAIRLERNGEGYLAAVYGDPQGELLSLPLVYQEEAIGSVQVAGRAPGEEFSRADRQLLENIAHQAGAAAQSVRLHTQLLRSRAQIVNEREEERRRIRRDLHDELGPILASQSLTLAAVRQMIRTAPEKAESIVDELAQQSQETVTEIRRLVHGLRPPALDQLGLVEAVRDFVRRGDSDSFDGLGPVFDITAPGEGLPELPAAVEVNAYRIVLEALSNAARHAQAQHCAVKFQVEYDGHQPGALVVRISDDGAGIPAQFRAGVGLRSMRERAEEIGGRVAIEPRQPRGTQISAWLPLSF